VLGPSGTTLTDGDGNPNDGNAQVVTTTNGPYYAVVRANSGAGLLGQYILRVSMAYAQPPVITSDTLPAEGTASTAVIDRFTVNFTEDMRAASVNNIGDYDLRAAGVDGRLGTADDVIYTLAPLGAPYAAGTSFAYRVVDGPLQPGSYQLPISTGPPGQFGQTPASPSAPTLTPLTAHYARHFTLVAVPPFVLESRSNDSPTTATSLSPGTSPAFDGSFTASGSTLPTGTNPYDRVRADFDKDSHADLAVVNTSS